MDKNIDNLDIGIKNIGNTCYINSLTQCLIYTESFRDHMMNEININKIYNNILKKNNNLINEEKFNISRFTKILDIKISYQMKKLFDNYMNNRKIEPKKYVISICKNSDIFKYGFQNDAQELYLFFINKINEELKDNIELNIDNNIIDIYDKLIDLPYELNDKINNLLKFVNNDLSVITTPFLGFINSIIKCECNYITQNINIFFILQLNLIKTNNDYIDINDCLNDYNNESLCEDYNCPKCKQQTIRKQDNIWLPPQILVIHLKRFITSYENNVYTVNKISDDIKYDEILDMSKFIYNKKREYKYELYAICNHYGSLDGGHYFSYIKKNNIWYVYDDNKVYKLENINYLQNNYAYILFYRLNKNE